MLALTFLGGCSTYEGPSLPTVLHMPSDVPAAEREAWEAEAAHWNAALLQDAIARIDDRESGCGIFVVRADGRLKPGKGGYTDITAPCRVEVQLLPGMDPDELHMGAAHELGHALHGDNWHSSNPFSVLYEVGLTAWQMPKFCELNPSVCDEHEERPQEIQAEELEFVRARLRPAAGGVL